MVDVYKRVMVGSAAIGGLTGAFYLTASTLAYLDGVGAGIEIAPPAIGLTLIVIVCSTVTAGGAWLIRRGHADAADRHIRPAVRAELDDAIAENMPLLVAATAEAVAKRIEPALHTIATGASNRTAAVLREAVTADITDIINGVYRRGQIAGAILQSQTTSGRPLRPVRQMGPTEGD